jgi:hypothetical protein
LVRDYFHGHVDYVVNFCGSANWAYICFFRREAVTDEV